MAKALIMLVRVLGLASIILGMLVWSEHQRYLGAHIGCGFLVSIAVFAMAMMALTKKVVLPGSLGAVSALLLPLVGLKQFPLTFHTLGAIQVVHIVLALLTIGLAERLYSAIRSAA